MALGFLEYGTGCRVVVSRLPGDCLARHVALNWLDNVFFMCVISLEHGIVIGLAKRALFPLQRHGLHVRLRAGGRPSASVSHVAPSSWVVLVVMRPCVSVLRKFKFQGEVVALARPLACTSEKQESTPAGGCVPALLSVLPPCTCLTRTVCPCSRGLRTFLFPSSSQHESSVSRAREGFVY
jgi:hypothetical protein